MSTSVSVGRPCEAAAPGVNARLSPAPAPCGRIEARDWPDPAREPVKRMNPDGWLRWGC